MIICFGIVGSVWIFQRQNPDTQKKVTSVKVENQKIALGTTSDPRGKWLNIDDISTTKQLSSKSAYTYPDEGTYTDQISKDFFSQYLLLANQNNGQISQDQADQIAQNTLSSQDYTKAVGVQYTINDIHVGPTTNKDLAKKYVESMNSIFKKRDPGIKDSELTIVNRAITSGKESDLQKLDPIIDADKKIISDLLELTIPSDAVTVHLQLINSASNVLSNTEAMRQSFSDPIRSFVGMSQYKQHSLDFYKALQSVSDYLSSQK